MILNSGGMHRGDDEDVALLRQLTPSQCAR